MKKILALAAVLVLSACGCLNSDDEEPVITYKNVQTRPDNCDYFDGKTCYRYTRRVTVPPATRYRPARPIENVAPARPAYGCQNVPCGCPQAPCAQRVAPAPVFVPTVVPAPCGGCAPQVSATREPVEVVYKKTTYTTVYEPKTSSSVSYEREPYAGQPVMVPAVAPCNKAAAPAAPVPVESSPTMVLDNEPAE